MMPRSAELVALAIQLLGIWMSAPACPPTATEHTFMFINKRKAISAHVCSHVYRAIRKEPSQNEIEAGARKLEKQQQKKKSDCKICTNVPNRKVTN